MINVSDITKTLFDILGDNLEGYEITRNRGLNVDISQPLVQGHGWIGIYKETMSYEPLTLGGKYMLATIQIKVELQCSSAISGEDAEDKLQTAEKEIMDILIENKTIAGTVDMTMSYDIEYEYNYDIETIYFNSAVITLELQKKTS